MQLKDKILIVEDEKSIANYMRTIIENNGYSAVIAGTGLEAINMLTSHCPEVMLLDLGLPDIEGLSVVKNIREWSQVPIIVVSARNFERDKVEVLEAGADDYITKPFGASELLARIKVALRHRQNSGGAVVSYETGKLNVKDLEIDFDKHKVSVRGSAVHLTQNEYKIVCLLARNAGKVISYSMLMKEIWGPQSGDNNQILRVNMTNIRHKLELDPAQPEYIKTELGIGYIMSEE